MSLQLVYVIKYLFRLTNNISSPEQIWTADPYIISVVL